MTLYEKIELTKAEQEERDLFNQRKGEMKYSISIIEKDLIMYTKKLNRTSNHIRNLDFVNIGFSSVIVFFLVIIGILESTNIFPLNSGISVSVLSGFELLRNLAIIVAIKSYLGKQKINIYH